METSTATRILIFVLLIVTMHKDEIDNGQHQSYQHGEGGNYAGELPMVNKVIWINNDD
jgi:hypothetical protein